MALNLDEQGSLLRQIIISRGGSQPTIQSYNHFVRYRIPKIIESEKIEFSSSPGVYASFSSPMYVRPTVTDLQSNGEPRKLLPYEARMKNLSYTAQLFAKLRLFQNVNGVETPIPGQEMDVFLGKIPVMIYSELDHLHDLSPNERYKLGDPEKDPGGYFIIKGAEKVLLNIEKLRTLAPYLYAEKDNNYVIKYTSQTLMDTTLVVVLENKQNNIHVTFSKLKLSKSINIFYIFYLLGLGNGESTVDNVLQLMDTFIYDQDPQRQSRRRKELRQYLKSTIATFEKEVIHGKSGKAAITEAVFDRLNLIVDDADIKNTPDRNDRLLEMVQKEMFKNIALDPNQLKEVLFSKLRLLASMVVKYVEFKNGYQNPDDRDSWANKRLTDAGEHMKTQFVIIWKFMIRKIREAASKFKSVQDVKKSIKDNYMTEQFIKVFTNGLWGGSYTKTREVTIVDILKRDTLLAVHAHIRRIGTQTNSRAQIRDKRLIHNTSWGAVCPTMTPEGQTCGLVKDLALTAYISLERDGSMVLAYINGTYHNLPKENEYNSIYLNGVHIGYGYAEKITELLRNLRINQRIPFDTEILLDEQKNLTIMTTSGRICRPLLRVDPNTQELIIDQKKLRGRQLTELMKEGAIEYIDIAEQQQPTIYIAETVDKLRSKIERKRRMGYRLTELGNDPNATKEEMESAQIAFNNIKNELSYTHAEIDPTAILGVSASIIPLPEFMPNPRGAYQASMGKQALGPNSSRIELRYDTTVKTLTNPGVPLFTTDAHEQVGLDEYPAGDQAIIAITTYGGENQEDAIVFNKASLERGMFNLTIYHSYKETVSHDNNRREILQIPDSTYQTKPAHRYSKLDPDTGIVRINSYVEPEDCLVGKLVVSRSANGEEIKDASLYVEIGKKGYVDDVFITKTVDSWKLIRIRLRENRTPQTGDKLASRYAQKGVIGGIIPEADMPYIVSDHELLNGVRPDIIFNPHGIPSRMTVGKLIEMFVGKYTAITGERINATAFRRFSYEKFRDELVNLGFSATGKEKMVNGITGREMDVEIFVGPTYYQVLRHLVEDKMQARGRTGSINSLTHQPISGIRKEGGLRMGEMERDALIEHGASNILTERLMVSSDAYRAIVCNECGNLAVSNVTKAEISCQICPNPTFGQVTIPYVFKLFINYLSAIGINLKIRTKEI